MTMLQLTDCPRHSHEMDVEGPPLPSKPDESWDLDQLTAYVKRELGNSDRAREEVILQTKKLAVHLFWSGRALALIRDKCKAKERGAWVKWQEDQKLSVSTVNEAIRLYEEAKTEEAVAGLGITEAKKLFVFPKKDEPAVEAENDKPKPKRGGRRPPAGEWQTEKPIEEDKPDLLADLAGIENVLANWTTGLPGLADQDRQAALETVARIKKHLEEIFNAAA